MNEKFLDAFRALDSELKLEGKTVLDFENSLDSTMQEKLKVCRIMRNYMSHNDTQFITASAEQIKFLDSLVMEIRKKSHTVKDEMKKITPIKYSSAIIEIIKQINKFPIVPVETKDKQLYLVDTTILLKQLAASNKKIVIPAKLPKYKYISKTERVDQVAKGLYIVTDNGKADGKYLGVYYDC